MSRKAYTVDFMREYTSRDDMIAHFQKCYRGCTAEKANRLLHNEQQLWQRDRERCRLWHDPKRESWKGRKTQAATKLIGLPTEGGKDNLNNFLNSSIGNRYLTTAELKALLESKYGADKLETKYKRARDPRRQILKYHGSVHRWNLWSSPEPNAEDFALEPVDGKYGVRLHLYGLMPRGLKHKPGEKFVREESQVLQWMSQRSGETDLAVVDAEYNRLPRSSFNSDNPDDKDANEIIDRAIRLYDRGTGETIGILTYRAEQAVAAADDAEPEQANQSDSNYVNDYGPQDGEGYFWAAFRLTHPDGPEDEYFEEYWLGNPGKRLPISDAVLRQIDEAPRRMSRKDAGKLLRELGVTKVELCIANLLEEEVWCENDNALLSGVGRIFKDEREAIANLESAEKAKKAELLAQAKADAEAKARIEAEEREKAKAKANAVAATELAEAKAAALARDGICGVRIIVSEEPAPEEVEAAA